MIDKEHFLFRANSRHASFKAIGFDHEFKGTKILEQRLHKGSRLFLVKFLLNVVFAHRIQTGSGNMSCQYHNVKLLPTRFRLESLVGNSHADSLSRESQKLAERQS